MVVEALSCSSTSKLITNASFQGGTIGTLI